MKTYSGLTQKQILLYKNSVAELESLIKDSEGIQKKGIVLSSLMKFKQLCNHPDQFSGTGSFKEEESGKFQRLREICETIHEKREQVLVFTQFKEMTAPLEGFIESIFHRKGLVLHGSVPVAKRKQLIESFQGDDYVPFMVLFLKASGVGLNLTRANHVIHFDRWWNPAVENQATERAFRIGQKKNVIVHKFITRGTIEEKIDLMLEEKQHSRAEQKSSRIISDDDDTSLSELFGVDLEDGSETKVDSVEQVDAAAGDKDLKTLKPPKAKAKSVPKKQSKPAKKKLFNSRREPVSPLDEIEKIIKSYKSGIAVADIIARVSMEPQKVRNILYRLKAQGKIENISRGIYKIK